MPHYVASDLDLHCLLLSHSKETRLLLMYKNLNDSQFSYGLFSLNSVKTCISLLFSIGATHKN